VGAMMLPTHLAATLVGCLLLARWRGLDREGWTLALLFGVAIDVDHLLEVPAYLAAAWPARGLAAFSPGALAGHGAGWHSIFHAPAFGLVVAAVAIGLRTAVPLAAWALHQTMDWAVGAGVGFATPAEFALLAALLAALAFLARDHVRRTWPGWTVARWARASLAAAVLPSIVRREG